ncbi:MAG: MAPEG family protein [Proteobacteria bacterium]|nr:MAPEG family protein [Pseudomonadota bacterium]MBI3496708.1 MAPEG family protein [Pseudomonadota bacterium]
MTTDLIMLTWSSAFCVVLFLPYVLSRSMVWGLADTVGYPKNPPALPDWAERAYRAHVNMVENLAPFAALVLVAQVSGHANATTALGATLFFWARVAHAIVFIAGIPWLRTLAFLVGVIGMAMIFLAIIG